MSDPVSKNTADPDGEWVPPQAVELHWLDPVTGASLGKSIPGGVPGRPGWVGLYGDKWVEIFPGGEAYAKPN